MLVDLLTIFIILIIARGVWHGFRLFWGWLDGGKTVERAGVGAQLSASARAALARIEEYRAARKLGQKKEGKQPRFSREQLREISRARVIVRNAYLDTARIGWFQVVMVFFIGSVLGLVVEQVWMFVIHGLTETRYGLVWGPFSPLYGLGALLLTVITFEMRKHKARDWQVFAISVAVGGVLEQFAGWALFTFLGAVSWDYSAVPGAITRWVAVPFLVFWGVLGLFWYKTIMPALLHGIGKADTKRKVIFVALLSVYLVADIVMTLACFDRRAQRDAGIEPANAFEEWVDEHYSDEFMSHRFQNMVIDKAA